MKMLATHREMWTFLNSSLLRRHDEGAYVYYCKNKRTKKIYIHTYTYKNIHMISYDQACKLKCLDKIHAHSPRLVRFICDSARFEAIAQANARDSKQSMMRSELTSQSSMTNPWEHFVIEM